MGENNICQQCGMVCSPREYHPYAACVMFRRLRQGDKVRELLESVRRKGEQDASDRLAALESQVLIREDLEAQGYEVPIEAKQWSRNKNGQCYWWTDMSDTMYRGFAPDLFPETDGPIWRPILSRGGE